MTIFERPLRYHMQDSENRRINVNFLDDSCNFTVIIRYFSTKAHENGKKILVKIVSGGLWLKFKPCRNQTF